VEQQRVDVDDLAVELGLAAGDPGEVEQVVDQPRFRSASLGP